MSRVLLWVVLGLVIVLVALAALGAALSKGADELPGPDSPRD